MDDDAAQFLVCIEECHISMEQESFPGRPALLLPRLPQVSLARLLEGRPFTTGANAYIPPTFAAGLPPMAAPPRKAASVAEQV